MYNYARIIINFNLLTVFLTGSIIETLLSRAVYCKFFFLVSGSKTAMNIESSDLGRQ